MLNEEKAKRKGKPRNIWPLIAILLPLLACVVMGLAGYLIITKNYSNVPLLDGLSTNVEAERLILERLPIGSSRSEVEAFIAEQLQPSEACIMSNELETICRQANGRGGLCNNMQWEFIFYLENQLFSRLQVSYFGVCYY